MATNTILTLGGITRRALMVLENNLVAAKFVTREYQGQFAISGAKIGTTLNVRRPNRYVVTKAVGLVEQDTAEESVALVINQQHHVGMTFNQQDYTLSIDDFSDRFIKPAMAELANDIDQTVLAEYWNFYNSVGTPGTTPGSTAGVPSTAALALFLYGQAMAKGDYEAMPRDGDRAIIMEPTANVMLTSALSGLFHATTEVEEQYKTGTMGLAIGAKFSMDQNVATHVVGPLGGTPLAGTAVEGAATLPTTGWTAAAASRLLRGDVFTVANVFAVNPRSRVSTGQLRDFVVTANFSSDGAGAGSIAIDPPMISTGAKKTINALPASGAALTIRGAANTSTPQNLLLHKDAITLACVDLVDPSPYGVKAARVSSNKLGLSMLCAQQYDINDTNIRTRIDILFGVKTLRPSQGVRIFG